jgi:hypothetical protein
MDQTLKCGIWDYETVRQKQRNTGLCKDFLDGSKAQATEANLLIKITSS